MRTGRGAAALVRLGAGGLLVGCLLILSGGARGVGAADSPGVAVTVDRQEYASDLPVDPHGSSQTDVYVDTAGGTPRAQAYLHLDIAPLASQRVDQLLLTLTPDTAPGQDTGTTTIDLQACLLAADMATPFDPASPPEYDCSISIPGVQATDGSFTFDITRLFLRWQTRNTGAVILPGLATTTQDVWSAGFVKAQTKASAVLLPPPPSATPVPVAVATAPAAMAPPVAPVYDAPPVAAQALGIPAIPQAAATAAAMPAAAPSPSSAAVAAPVAPAPLAGAAPAATAASVNPWQVEVGLAVIVAALLAFLLAAVLYRDRGLVARMRVALAAAIQPGTATGVRRPGQTFAVALVGLLAAGTLLVSPAIGSSLLLRGDQGGSGAQAASGASGAAQAALPGSDSGAPGQPSAAATASAGAAPGAVGTAGAAVAGGGARPAGAAGGAAGASGGGRAPVATAAPATRACSGSDIHMGYVREDSSGAGAAVGSSAGTATSIPAQDREMQALVAYANDTGGVCGRKITAQGITLTSTSQEDERYSDCISFTEDQHDTVVIDSTLMVSERTLSCFAQHRTTIVTLGSGVDTDFLDGISPYAPTTWAALDRSSAVLVSGLASQHYFDHATVGVVLRDYPSIIRTYNDVVLPRLKAMGFDPVVATYSGSDPSTYGSQSSAAILNFEGKGVDHVLMISTVLEFLAFSNAAEAQQFHPRYGFGDAFALGGAAAFFGTADQLANSLTISSSPAEIQDRDQAVSATAPVDRNAVTPGIRRCLDVLTKYTGQDYYNPSQAGASTFQYWFCDHFFLWLDAARGVTSQAMTPTNLPTGLATLGSSFQSVINNTDSFGSGRLDGASSYRIGLYASDNKIFVAATPWSALP